MKSLDRTSAQRKAKSKVKAAHCDNMDILQTHNSVPNIGAYKLHS